MGRIEMSKRELRRVETLARVKAGELRLVDAAVLMRLSYRQTKRLWKRYGEERAVGLRHRSAGRRSNRAYAERLRRKGLRLVRKKYGGGSSGGLSPSSALRGRAGQDLPAGDSAHDQRRLGGPLGQWAEGFPSLRCRRWPCPPLRPERSPCGLAGLRSGPGQRPSQNQKTNTKPKTKAKKNRRTLKRKTKPKGDISKEA